MAFYLKNTSGGVLNQIDAGFIDGWLDGTIIDAHITHTDEQIQKAPLLRKRIEDDDIVVSEDAAGTSLLSREDSLLFVVSASEGQTLQLIQAILPQLQAISEKGVANGYAPLDGANEVPLIYIPTELTRAADLLSNIVNLGSSLVGINDTNAIFQATNVEAALQEVKALADANSLGLGQSWSLVELHSNSNVTLSGEQTIDGLLTSVSRVLLTGQTDASENGIYLTDAGAWSRTWDANVSTEYKTNKIIYVSGGSVHAGHTYGYTGIDDPILETDDLTFIHKSMSNVGDGSITTIKIAPDAINSSRIADDSIDSEHYIDGSIDNEHLAGGIDPTKIAGFLNWDLKTVSFTAAAGGKYIVNNNVTITLPASLLANEVIEIVHVARQAETSVMPTIQVAGGGNNKILYNGLTWESRLEDSYKMAENERVLISHTNYIGPYDNVVSLSGKVVPGDRAGRHVTSIKVANFNAYHSHSYLVGDNGGSPVIVQKPPAERNRYGTEVLIRSVGTTAPDISSFSNLTMVAGEECTLRFMDGSKNWQKVSTNIQTVSNGAAYDAAMTANSFTRKEWVETAIDNIPLPVARYGSMHSTSAQTIAAVLTDQQIVFDTISTDSDITVSTVTNSFTALSDGVYNAQLHCNYTYDTANVGLKIKVNGATIVDYGNNAFFTTTNAGSGEQQSPVSINYPIDLTAGDIVTFFIYRRDTGGGADVLSSAHASLIAISGAAAAPATVLLNGTVNPTTEGNEGDFYLNTSTNTMFGPKTSGVWGAGTELTGPDAAVVQTQAPIVIDGVTTAPTKGTTDQDVVQWLVSGDKVHCKYKYGQSGNGANGSGHYLWKLPEGLSFDATHHTFVTSTLNAETYLNSIGRVVAFNAQNVWTAAGVIVPYNSTHFRILLTQQNSSSTSILVGSAAWAMGSRPYFSIEFDFWVA